MVAVVAVGYMVAAGNTVLADALSSWIGLVLAYTFVLGIEHYLSGTEPDVMLIHQISLVTQLGIFHMTHILQLHSFLFFPLWQLRKQDPS